MNDYYDGAGLALFGVLFFILIIFALAGYVLGSWFLMKIFDKAGVQGRWRAWVPVYNTMVFAKLGDLNPWLILIAIGAGLLLNWIPVIGPLISIAAWAVSILAAWRVGLKLQKEAAWVILYFFLPIVWLGILGFDRSRWNTAVQPAPWAGNSFLRDSTTWAGIPAQAGSYPAPTATQGYGAPGAFPPAPGTQPPAGYAAPPTAYTPPPAFAPPPAGYGEPPAGYTPPPAPPSGYTPPPAPPAGYTAAPSAASAPEPPAAPRPPSAPEPPAAPPAPIAPEPPAPAEPPAFPAPPVEPPPPITPEPAPPVAPEPAPPITPEPPVKPEPDDPRTV